MADKSKNENYSDQESRMRFEAALRGARIAGPRHVESAFRSVPSRNGKGARKLNPRVFFAPSHKPARLRFEVRLNEFPDT